MALNNGNEGEDKTFINLKLTSTVWPVEDIKKDAPVFTKLWDDYKPTWETFKNVSWKLLKLKSSFTPAKGRMWDIYWFKAFIEDGEEIYVIESTITNASKDLLNALLTQVGNEVKIWVYLNKNLYPSSSVRNSNDEFVEQRFDFKSLDTVTLHAEIDIVCPNTKEEDNWDISIGDIEF